MSWFRVMSLAVLLGSMGMYVTRSGRGWQVPKVICDHVARETHGEADDLDQ